jgi:hypothetical protein
VTELAEPAQDRLDALVGMDFPATPLDDAPSSTRQPGVLRVANRVADALGLFRRPLSTAEMMGLARRRTGLADFGDMSFEMPLQLLFKSYEDEADLSPFGRMAARWDTLRFLQNLLMLKEAERRTPAILEQPITRPIFITGLPRSGSTFLYHLLAQDPSNLLVRCWETIHPCPGGDGDTRGAARWMRKVDRQLASFARLAPEFPSLHPMTAESPQECTEITGHVFQSLRFDTTHTVPSYTRWLDETGHLAAYRFHKRFLQHLQHRHGSRQWFLKCPDHVFALDAIRAVYPDARFVFTHRNPLDVLSSVAKLTEVVRRPFTRRIDRVQIGRQVSERWVRGAAILTETAETTAASSDRMINLKFRSFTGDPFRAIATLYEQLGLTLGREAETRIRSLIAARPNGGYGNNHSRLADYGLDAALESQRYRDYINQFGV